VLISRVLSEVDAAHTVSAPACWAPRQVGSSLGVALIGLVFYGHTNGFQLGLGFTALTAFMVARVTLRSSEPTG
jgi:hypothetical protein